MPTLNTTGIPEVGFYTRMHFSLIKPDLYVTGHENKLYMQLMYETVSSGHLSSRDLSSYRHHQ
jgi:hypothetical protein